MFNFKIEEPVVEPAKPKSTYVIETECMSGDADEYRTQEEFVKTVEELQDYIRVLEKIYKNEPSEIRYMDDSFFEVHDIKFEDESYVSTSDWYSGYVGSDLMYTDNCRTPIKTKVFYYGQDGTKFDVAITDENNQPVELKG